MSEAENSGSPRRDPEVIRPLLENVLQGKVQSKVQGKPARNDGHVSSSLVRVIRGSCSCNWHHWYVFLEEQGSLWIVLGVNPLEVHAV